MDFLSPAGKATPETEGYCQQMEKERKLLVLVILYKHLQYSCSFWYQET